jgi:hypothetical protein
VEFGCSGSDSSGSNAAAQCDQLGESVCQSNANCALETGLVTTSAQKGSYTDNCVAGFKGAVDCSRETKITGHPDVCESDVASTPCSFFDETNGLPVPASCKNIFQ